MNWRLVPIALVAMVCATGLYGANPEEIKMTVDNIHWYGHDSFRIQDGQKQVYIDPWQMPDGLPKADYILVTHVHHDHFSEPDIRKLSTDQTKVIAPPDVVKLLGGGATPSVPGQTLDLAGLKVTAVPAYNVNKKYHLRSSNWVGYVLTLSDGVTVYHAGDTDATPEMDKLKVDIALLPVSGTYVMTAAEAAAAANAFQPKVAIPMHYGRIVGSDADARKFKELFKGEAVIKQVETPTARQR